MDDRKVGVVGLGNMGGGIARNFQRAGLPLAVWDLDPAARDALAALPGVDEVLVAGEPERRRRIERERDGIPVDVTTWTEVKKAAAAIGLEGAALDKAAGI